MRGDVNFANARNVGEEVHKIKNFPLDFDREQWYIQSELLLIVLPPFLSFGSDLALYHLVKAEKDSLYGL